MSKHARILLIAEPPAGPRIQAHLQEYGTCDLITAREYRGVPFGTEWVFVMNADGASATVFRDARKVGATPASIPAGWSSAQQKLTSIGFFRRMVKDTIVVLTGPLRQRPFSVLANASAPPEAIPAAPPAAEEEVTKPVEERMTDPTPTPTSTTDAPAAPATPVEEPPMPRPSLAGALSTRPFTDEERRKAIVNSKVARVEASQARAKIMRLIFTTNPSATIHEAMDACRAMCADKRSLGSEETARIRNEVRVAQGLPPIEGPRGYMKGGNAVAKSQAAAPAEAAPAEATAAEALPVASPPAPAPVLAPAPQPGGDGPRLPPDVEAAARLLREALEGSPSVMAFTLTYRQGARAKVTWIPIIEASIEV